MQKLVIIEPCWDRAEILKWVVTKVHLVYESWKLPGVTHQNNTVLLAVILLHLDYRIAIVFSAF